MFELTVFFNIEKIGVVFKTWSKLRIKWNFELTVFELAVPDLYMLMMVCAPLLIILLVVCQYMSVLYIVLPDNGLMSILTLRAPELDSYRVPMYQCETAVLFFQFVAQATQDLSLWNLSLVWFYQPVLHCI